MYPNQIDEKSNRNIFDGLNTEKIGDLIQSFSNMIEE
jgi:hypothetical protein